MGLPKFLIFSIIFIFSYAFVDFREFRDADDAVHDLNGKELMGVRFVI